MTHPRNVSGEIEAQNRKACENGTNRLLTVNETARALNVGRTLVYKLMDQGELGYVKIGHARRVRPEDIRDFISRKRVGGSHVA